MHTALCIVTSDKENVQKRVYTNLPSTRTSEYNLMPERIASMLVSNLTQSLGNAKYQYIFNANDRKTYGNWNQELTCSIRNLGGNLGKTRNQRTSSAKQ